MFYHFCHSPFCLTCSFCLIGVTSPFVLYRSVLFFPQVCLPQGAQHCQVYICHAQWDARSQPFWRSPDPRAMGCNPQKVGRHWQYPPARRIHGVAMTHPTDSEISWDFRWFQIIQTFSNKNQRISWILIFGWNFQIGFLASQFGIQTWFKLYCQTSKTFQNYPSNTAVWYRMKCNMFKTFADHVPTLTWTLWLSTGPPWFPPLST